MNSAIENQINIDVSNEAAQRLQHLNSTGNSALRLRVLSGGCNGFQSKFQVISKDEINDNDNVIVKNDQQFIIDKLSAKLVNGSTIDFEEDLAGAEFIVKNNPNANSKCGCGSSFSANF